MKVKHFKTLLHDDPRTAMLFDLTERFPRGPNAKLRDHDYKDRDGQVLQNGWGSNTAPYLREGVESAGGSPMTGGWDPYRIFELSAREWDVEALLRSLEVPIDMSMNKHDTWHCEAGHAKLFKTGAQLTRRARRAANRIKQAKKWVEENIGTAVYKISSGYYSRQDVYVHADSEDGARAQFDLFMASAFNEHCEGWDEGRGVSVSYVRPAKTPMELMALNQPFIDQYVSSIEKKRKQIEKLQKECAKVSTLKIQKKICLICSFLRSGKS